MPRIVRIAGSFVAVVVAYWAYAMLAVPWIEPSAAAPKTTSVAGGGSPKSAVDLPELQLRRIVPLFKSGDWELNKPTILESDRAKLLFKEYHNLGNGLVKLFPCTILFDPDSSAKDDAQQLRQTIVLQAPEGALLQFDKPIDLNQPNFGRLVSGRLDGVVTIRSDWKEPGPEDDLRVATRNLQLSEQAISTPEPVEFRWGPHFGSGREMTMKFITGPARPGVKTPGPNVTGIASFEIRYVDRLHLDMGPTTTTAGTRPDAAPVEVACRGPFLFDVAGRVAMFRDAVDVRKLNPSGPADQILCDLLSIYFIERPKPRPLPPINGRPNARADAADAGSLDLVAQRLEARGAPATVTAPSRTLNVRGPRIEYNLLEQSVTLDGGQEVFLQQGPNEIHARSLYYHAAEQGRLGQALARGPGWLRGQAAETPARTLEAAWNDALRIAPDGQNHLISLTGGAALTFPEAGRIQAREIFFRVVEPPPAAPGGSSRLRPEYMLARTDVRIEARQLSGKVEQMEVWFEEGEQTSPGGNRGGVAQGIPWSGASPTVAAVGRPVGRSVDPAASAGPNPSVPAAVPLQRFEVVGRTLSARVLLGGSQPGISRLLIEDNACFQETQTSRPDEKPLVIRGDRLEAVDASGTNAAVTVVGQPARFEGRGLRLAGSNINLHRGKNRVWIDGPGQMDLQMTGESTGAAKPATAMPAGSMTVNWRRCMEFNGQIARFEDSVIAATPPQVTPSRQLRTEKMEVQLHEMVQFAAANPSAAAPQVEEIRCYGGVLMENRDFDAQRQPIAYDRLQTADLTANLLSGELTANGPGWFNSVRRNSGGPVQGIGRPVADAGKKDSASEMQCLHVRFQKSILGNLLRRRFTFHDQVRTTYAPTGDWEAMIASDNPDRLGPTGVVVRCNQLSVLEMLVPLGTQRAVEIEALGNAVTEGTTFTARGHRITYAEAKDLLVLEGDGRNDAELFRQLEVGAPTQKAAAKKIYYWPKTKQLKVDGARSFEIGP